MELNIEQYLQDLKVIIAQYKTTIDSQRHLIQALQSEIDHYNKLQIATMSNIVNDFKQDFMDELRDIEDDIRHINYRLEDLEKDEGE